MTGSTGARSTTVVSGVVLADDGEVGQVRIEDGRLTFSPVPPGTDTDRVTGWALPGLVDVHCHIGLGAQGAVDDATTRVQARTTLASGVLAVRDAGTPRDTRFLSAAGPAPRIIRAGRHIARPKRYLRYFAVDLEDPDDLAAEAATQALAGDGWVKLVGDWIDRDAGAGAVLTPLWTPQQLNGAVAAAHARGARVTVHTFSTEAVTPLLDAGVDGIEHGTGMSPEQIDRAAAAGVSVTPTLLQVENFPGIAAQAEAKYPAYAAQMRAMHARRFDHVADLHEAGVQLLIGTDAGGMVTHGRIADEAALLVRAGVPAADVVAAATRQARTFLGLPSLSEGAPADLVVYPADPRTDISVLAHPTAVFLGGQRIR